MAHLYAQQLMVEGDIRKAVSYTLISGQKSQAIEMFSSQQLHREAVALTRCVFPDESSQVQESISCWASKAVGDGNLELAAKCFLANGEMAEAARTLARRSDSPSLKLSADLATSAGLDQLAAAYLNQAEDITNSVTGGIDPSPTPPTINEVPPVEEVKSIDQAPEADVVEEKEKTCDDIPLNGRT